MLVGWLVSPVEWGGDEWTSKGMPADESKREPHPFESILETLRAHNDSHESTARAIKAMGEALVHAGNGLQSLTNAGKSLDERVRRLELAVGLVLVLFVAAGAIRLVLWMSS